MPKEKYDPPDPRRCYTIMSAEDAASGKKSHWAELEISGESKQTQLHFFKEAEALSSSAGVFFCVFFGGGVQGGWGVWAAPCGPWLTWRRCTSTTTTWPASRQKSPSCPTWSTWTCRPISSAVCPPSWATWSLSGVCVGGVHHLWNHKLTINLRVWTTWSKKHSLRSDN